MRGLKWILFVISNSLFCQQDYYSLYKQISDSLKKVNEITDAHFALMQKDSLIAKDTVLLHLAYRKHAVAYNQKVLPLFKNIRNKTFPDISFTDKNFANYNLSDFSKQNIILNYNYLYCKPCVSRIDSTLNIIQNKNYKMIVLLNELYRKDVNDLADYEDRIIIGFMSPETTALVSLESGDDKVYLLNQKRRIEYFDAIEPINHREKWLIFLRNYLSNERN